VKILSVEDNDINQMMITERLNMRGYEVLQAFDGNQALHIAANEPMIDLILLDIGLPDMNGLDVVDNLRSKKLHQNTPILVLSGHTTSDYQERASNLGITKFYPKPVNFTELFKQISLVSNQAHI